MSNRTRWILLYSVLLLGIVFLWSSPVLYPLRTFVVLAHEASHALAAVLTGGRLVSIGLSPDEGGYALTSGGNAFIILSAGYLGSLAFGMLLLWLASGRRVRGTALAVGAAVLLLTIFYIRSLFGFIFGLAFGGTMLIGARHLPRAGLVTVLRVMGLTSCLYAFFDIKSDVLDRPELASDARMLAEMTHVPTMVWGVLWMTIAVASSLWLLRRTMPRR